MEQERVADRSAVGEGEAVSDGRGEGGEVALSCFVRAGGLRFPLRQRSGRLLCLAGNERAADKGGGGWHSRGHGERSRNALNPTAPECPRWYRSKTFLLGLFGLSCLFWLWVDSAQIATRLVAASERPSGFLCLQSGYGFVSLTIQASEAGEIPSMYWRKRTSVGMSDGPRFSPPSAVNPSRWHFEVSLPVRYLWAGYLQLWSGLLLWRAWRVRTRRGVAFGVDPS